MNQLSWMVSIRLCLNIGNNAHTGKEKQDARANNAVLEISMIMKPHVMRSRAQEIADRYPLGKTIMIAYNPVEPGVATLDPGLGTFVLLGMGLPFFVLGA